MKLFKNGSLAIGNSADLESADVLVDDDGLIRATGRELEADESTEIIDCGGCILVPGMFDLHVHSRDPGGEHKETLDTCAAAALHGGVTGMVLMPDTDPPIDSGNQVKNIHERAEGIGSLDILQSGCLTKGRSGEKLAGYSGMVTQGSPLLTDSGRDVPCPDLLRRAMEYAHDFDILVACFCDTPALTRGGVINEGRASYRLGLPGAPAISQEIAIDRNLRVAQNTGARIHIQLPSTAVGARSLRRAKEDGAAVSSEVALHHLLFNEEMVTDYDSRFKFDPPLRLPEDCAALWDALLDDTIDLITSDHSPHTPFEKSTDFGSAPSGSSSLETTVLVFHDRFIKTGKCGWNFLIRKYSDNPRTLIGKEKLSWEEGRRAEFFVFDPESETRLSTDYFKTKSPVSLFQDETVSGAIRETVIGVQSFS